ncbi:MAG: CoA-transferase [Thermodesulfobacteriota bacterium]|nr:CoA-transferase [Thermodesulfobacteriota bacterium]
MSKVYEGEYTISELQSILICRQIKFTDKIIGPGFYNDVVYNGALLAMKLHAPNTLYLSGIGWSSLAQAKLPRQTPMYIPFEYRFMAVCEKIIRGHDEIQLSAGGPRQHCNVFFLGAMQVDKYGNQNISIRGTVDKPTFRGPGIIGLQTFATFMDRYYIYTRNHDTRTFVEEVDFISAPGYKNKHGDRKSWNFEKYGWNPNGPAEIISPIAVMDFDEETKAMRIKSVHPGHTVEEVVEKTGFDIIVPDKVPSTDPPTEEEITMLRTQIDQAASLKRLHGIQV